MPRMGGSSRDSYTNVDTAVGTIVWVRRRNGSWWPGRIISDAELSTANLLSPRSGTPVKLLGREDGSVDWYNIEKSKRVKPFRCGDFEECIEKAKAVAGLPTKKREKYARREDAILHALELEKQQQDCSSEFVESSVYRKRENSYNGRDCSTIEVTRSRPRSRRRRPAKPVVSEDDTDSGNSNSLVYPDEEENSGGLSSSGRGQDEQEWNPEEEEVQVPRMRGLQEFGLRPTGRGRRSLTTTAIDENLENYQSCVTQSGKCSTLNDSKAPSSFTTKRKRSVAGTVEDGSVRKRDRRRPLTQVLESSAKYLPPYEADLLQLVDEDDALVEGNQALGGMERMGVEFTSSPATEGCREDFLNHTTGVADRTCCSFSGHAPGECCDGSPPSEAEPADGITRGTPLTDHQKSKRCLRQEHGRATKRTVVKHEYDEDVSGDTEQVTARRQPSRLGHVHKCENETGCLQEWVEVLIEKESNVQKASVPMVLLASKLTRRPVVGHPVVVEALDSVEFDQEDKSLLISRSSRRAARDRKVGLDDADAEDDEKDEDYYEDEVVRHPPGKTIDSPWRISSRKKACGKPLVPHKESLSKKLVKRVVQSSRKTRTLSSIACEQRAGVNFQERVGVNNRGGGAGDGHDLDLKTEESGWPVMACVPVRLALSRIKAAVSGNVEA